ncbi:MAG TPA: DUF2933 domain-containing protein [Burkholderiales bacterium]
MNTPANPKAPWWRSRNGLVLLGFLAIAAFFLWTEHQAHLLGALPFILLALCPLLHIFGHGGHGGHGANDSDAERPRRGGDHEH